MHNNESYTCVMAKCHNNALKKLILETYNKIPVESLDPTENEGTFNPHVTILYGIYTSNIDQILQSFQNVTFINYRTLGLSTFNTNEKYDVLKIDISSIDLQYLNKKLRHTLRYKNIYPKYKPHMTIAYLKKDQPVTQKLIELPYFKNLHDISHMLYISTADEKKFNFNLQSKRLEQIK